MKPLLLIIVISLSFIIPTNAFCIPPERESEILLLESEVPTMDSALFYYMLHKSIEIFTTHIVQLKMGHSEYISDMFFREDYNQNPLKISWQFGKIGYEYDSLSIIKIKRWEYQEVPEFHIMRFDTTQKLKQSFVFGTTPLFYEQVELRRDTFLFMLDYEDINRWHIIAGLPAKLKDDSILFRIDVVSNDGYSNIGHHIQFQKCVHGQFYQPVKLYSEGGIIPEHIERGELYSFDLESCVEVEPTAHHKRIKK